MTPPSGDSDATTPPFDASRQIWPSATIKTSRFESAADAIRPSLSLVPALSTPIYLLPSWPSLRNELSPSPPAEPH